MTTSRSKQVTDSPRARSSIDTKSYAEHREEALAAEASSWDTAQIKAAEPGDIPIIDISGLIDPEGRLNRELSESDFQTMALALGAACREVGFFYLVGHQIPRKLSDQVFQQNRKFHALPLAEKMAIAMDKDIYNDADNEIDNSIDNNKDKNQPDAPRGIGYLPLMHQKLPRRALGNNNEAFLVKKDRELRLADNLWPDPQLLPSFRGVIEEYARAMEGLALALLPLYAASLGVEREFFAEAFSDPLYRLRLTHYPSSSSEHSADSHKSSVPPGFGIAPHVDTTFLTILAQDAPGLTVFSERRRCWITVPLVENALVVNTGELLRQWSNDEFLSVKHFANNRAAARQGEDRFASSRYSVPFFFNANADYPMACIPTCTGPDRPAKYPTLSYAQGQGVVQGE